MAKPNKTACPSRTSTANLPVSFVARILQTYVRPFSHLRMWPPGPPAVVDQCQPAFRSANTTTLYQACTSCIIFFRFWPSPCPHLSSPQVHKPQFRGSCMKSVVLINFVGRPATPHGAQGRSRRPLGEKVLRLGRQLRRHPHPHDSGIRVEVHQQGHFACLRQVWCCSGHHATPEHFQ